MPRHQICQKNPSMRLLYIMKFFVWESVLEYQEGKPHFLTTIALTGIDKSTLTICFRTKNFIGKDFLNSIDHLTDFDPETGQETDRIKTGKDTSHWSISLKALTIWKMHILQKQNYLDFAKYPSTLMYQLTSAQLILRGMTAIDPNITWTKITPKDKDLKFKLVHELDICLQNPLWFQN